MSNTTKIKIFISTLISFFVTPAVAFASPSPDAIGVLNPPSSIITRVSDVGLFFSNVVKLFMIIAGLFALFQFFLGGINYITAGGKQDSPARIKDAQQQIFHAILGLIVIAGTFVLTAIISYIFFGDATFILNPQLETL